MESGSFYKEIMTYPKQVMTTKELLEMGFPLTYLKEVSNRHGQKVCWKKSMAKNSAYVWDTEMLEKTRLSDCTRGYQW